MSTITVIANVNSYVDTIPNCRSVNYPVRISRYSMFLTIRRFEKCWSKSFVRGKTRSARFDLFLQKSFPAVN